MKIDFISMTPSGAISTLKGFHQVFMALLGILKKMHFFAAKSPGHFFTSSPRAVTVLLHSDSMQV